MSYILSYTFTDKTYKELGKSRKVGQLDIFQRNYDHEKLGQI